MSVTVLDASAVLAFLIRERGADRVGAAMDAGAVVSALTVQEVVSKLVQRGMATAEAAEAVEALGIAVHDLTMSLAVDAGGLFPLTRAHGLSHGDRACLALGRALEALVLTSDKAWSDVGEPLKLRVEQFR
jgi:PIN domain nuclease of toxin-antitoxin system